MLSWIAMAMIAGSLEQGMAALERYDLKRAAQLLNQATKEGPYRLDRYLRLYEQLGITHAYLEQEASSLAAFDMLLALEPGYALSYTLSPKATFLFEKARGIASGRQPPTLDLSYPRDRRAGQALPITVEVIADPKSYLRRAELRWQKQDEATFESVPIQLPGIGKFVTTTIGPRTPEPTTDQNLRLYLVAYDDQGNEVLNVGDAQHPRELTLTYVAPTAWYERWWVWAIAGTVVAGSVGTTVYLTTRSEPDNVPLRVRSP